MNIRFSLLLLTVAFFIACSNSIDQTKTRSIDQKYAEVQQEENSYLPFQAVKVDNFELEGFDVDVAYQIDSSSIIIAYSDGDLNTSRNPSNWGDRLILMKGDSILFQSKAVGDPYQYEPFFYRNAANDKIVIVCQLGNEENYGGEAFLLENGAMEFIGEINVESPHESPDNTSLIEIIRISEMENTINFSFDSDTLIDLTNDNWNRVKNNGIHYTFTDHHLTLNGL